MVENSRNKIYYECSITLTGDKSKIKSLVETMGWNFSTVDIDEEISYIATKRYEVANLQDEDVLQHLLGARRWLNLCGVNVVKDKLSAILFVS